MCTRYFSMLAILGFAWLALITISACGYPRLPDIAEDASGEDAFSPGFDRQRMIYDGLTQLGGKSVFEIFSVRLDGTGTMQLTSEPDAGDDPLNGPTGANYGTVSRDGRYLIFSVGPFAAKSLVVTNIDGSGRRVLTTGAHNSFAAISADGQRVAFESNRNSVPGIYVANFASGDAGPIVRITPADGHSYGHPCWGGNSTVTYTDATTNEIMLANVDGTNMVNLTNHPARDQQSVFSHDGSKIAFLSNRGGTNSDVWMMNADGTAPNQITTGGRAFGGVSFDLTGKYILFQDNQDYSTYSTAISGTEAPQRIGGGAGIGGVYYE